MHKYTHKHNLTRHIHFYRFLHDKYSELLIADTFRLVALSMISLFIPIFLIKTGFSVLEIIIMELFILLGSVLFHYYVLKKISRWGVKRTLVLSYMISIAMYFSMYSTQGIIGTYGAYIFLAMIAVFNILMNVLYWSAHHIYFLETTVEEDEGKKLGILKSIPSLVGIISPFLGAYLIDRYSFNAVFLLSAILMIVASSVLFFSDNIKVKTDLDYKEVLDFGRMRKNFIFFVYGLAYLTAGFVWPLFLFYSQVKLLSMGLLYLFSNLFHSAVSYFGGKMTDSINSKSIAVVGAAGHGLSFIFRALSQNIFSLTAFQIMGGAFGGLLSVVLDSRFFKNSHKDEANSIMNRELYMHLGRIFAVFIFLLFFSYFPIVRALSYTLLTCGFIVFSLSFVVVDAGKEYKKTFE